MYNTNNNSTKQKFARRAYDNNITYKNIGIIDDITIDFNEGLNVLTGETGAGKTLIIDSLAIVAGGRFSKEMIRKGENYSFVELSMYCPEDERAIDGNIIITREIYSMVETRVK